MNSAYQAGEHCPILTNIIDGVRYRARALSLGRRLCISYQSQANLRCLEDVESIDGSDQQLDDPVCCRAGLLQAGCLRLDSLPQKRSLALSTHSDDASEDVLDFIQIA